MISAYKGLAYSANPLLKNLIWNETFPLSGNFVDTEVNLLQKYMNISAKRRGYFWIFISILLLHKFFANLPLLKGKMPLLNCLFTSVFIIRAKLAILILSYPPESNF